MAVPSGKILTVLSFTSDGSTAAGGTQATVLAEQFFGIGASFSTVLRAYDPANLNDMPHTVVIAPPVASRSTPSTMMVNFTSAQNVTTFATYSITAN